MADRRPASTKRLAGKCNYYPSPSFAELSPKADPRTTAHRHRTGGEFSAPSDLLGLALVIFSIASLPVKLAGFWRRELLEALEPLRPEDLRGTCTQRYVWSQRFDAGRTCRIGKIKLGDVQAADQGGQHDARACSRDNVRLRTAPQPSRRRDRAASRPQVRSLSPEAPARLRSGAHAPRRRSTPGRP